MTDATTAPAPAQGPRVPAWRRPPRWLVVVAGLIALWAVLGFLVAPPILRSQLEKRLTVLLHRPVTLREVRLNPFAVSVTLRGFAVKEPDGSPLLAFEELYVDVAVLRHLRGGVRIAEIRLVQPVVGVAIEKGGRLNFADLLEPKEGAAPPPPAPKPSGPPMVFEIGHFELDRGALSFADRNRPQPFAARFEPLSITLDGFTTEPQKDGAYDFKARLGASTEIAWAGSIAVTPLHSQGTLSITGAALAPFSPYLAESTQLRVADGVLDLKLGYRFDASQSPAVIAVEGGSLRVSRLRVEPPGRAEPLVAFKQLAIEGISADVGAQKAAVGAITLDGLRVLARRGKDGVLELQALAGPKHPKPPPPPKPPSAPWAFTLGELKVADAAVRWEDAVPPEPARLEVDELSLTAGPYALGGSGATKLQLGARLFGAGKLTVAGSAQVNQAAAELDVALSRLPLAPLQPYVAQSLAATLASGAFDLKGHVSHQPGAGAAGPRTRFAGDLAVDGFSLADAGGREVAGWERFALERLEADTSPLGATLERVLLRGARVHARVEPDGTTNFSKLAKRPDAAPPAAPAGAEAAAGPAPAPAAPAKAPAAKAPPPRALVKLVALENLSFDFTDRSVAPPFTTRLAQVGGSVGPISSPKPARTRVDLQGKLDGARVLVTGAVRPEAKDTDADLVVSLAPWNLPPTTPYGVKFAGYPVEKGKLSLDLKYKVGGRKLLGSNLLVINQLTLGDHVDNPTATRLPVKLALAILTDRSGKLEIDLPVEGDLDAPDFRFGGIVVKALLNVLEKAATAPFALLGSLFGGGEDLGQVEFASGRWELEPPEQAKVEKLAKALVDRPALRLSISGLADPAGDRQGILLEKLEDELIARRRALAVPGRAPPPDDEPLSAADRSAGLRALFLDRVVAPREREAAQLKAEGKPVPPDLVPRRDLPAAELQPLVLATLQVEPQDLADLARWRAESVQEALAEVPGLEQERVFVAAPKAGAAPARRAELQLE